MSIPRYKINPLFGHLKDDNGGKFCEYRDYLKLESENARLAADLNNCRIALRVKYEENARLNAEVRDLAISNAVLRDDNEKLKAEVERMTKAVEGQTIDASYVLSKEDSERFKAKFERDWKAAKEGKQS